MSRTPYYLQMIGWAQVIVSVIGGVTLVVTYEASPQSIVISFAGFVGAFVAAAFYWGLADLIESGLHTAYYQERIVKLLEFQCGIREKVRRPSYPSR